MRSFAAVGATGVSVRRIGPVFLGLVLVTGLLTSGAPAWAADGDFVWAGAFGGPSSDEARGIASDSSGNMYITGVFRGAADFDPGAGTANRTSQGDTDIFVCKLGSAGNLNWAVAIGGSLEDYGAAVTVDASGNVLVTGYYAGTVDFDPGAGTFNLTSVGDSIDAFILKLDNDGNLVWARTIGRLDVVGNIDERGYAIATDVSGNVYVTGRFHDIVDFDPGPGTQNLTAAGSVDIFVLKLDSNGEYLGAEAIGGAAADYSYGITVDSANNIYLTGNFAGTADFDTGPGASTLTAQSSDAFVCRLDSAGDLVWARQLGGTGSDGGRGIALDSDGNVYSIGNFVDTADFDPGPGIHNITSTFAAAYVSKLDASGDFVWARAFVGGATVGTGIAVGGNDFIYATGDFNDTVNFDIGFSDFSMNASGSDAYVVKLNTAGGFGWAKQLVGGPSQPLGYSAAYGVATNANGDVLTAGKFAFDIDFDPGAGSHVIDTGEAVAATDAFLMKLEGVIPASQSPEVFAVTRADPSPTNAASVQFTVTFSESVNGVDQGDFSINTSGVTGAGITGVSGSGDTYTVTVGTGSGDGTIRLDVLDNDTIVATDDSTPLGGAGGGNGNYTTGESYSVDKTGPAVATSVPSSSVTTSGPVTFTITYSGAANVTLAEGNLTLNQTGDAAGDVSVSGSGNTTRTVVIENITGNGTLGISIGAGTATDALGNLATAAGPSATFDVSNSVIAVNIGLPSVQSTSGGPVSYVVTYENVSNVTLSSGDVVLNGTGDADASIAVGPVTKENQTLQRIVTLSSITGNGTLGISIAAGTATDDSAKSAPSAGPSATFTVDNYDPDVQSIVLSPAKGWLVTYIVTFTEPVSGVDASDFVITTTGTVIGSSILGISGGGAVYTVSIDSGGGDGTLRLDLADDDSVLDSAGNPLGGPGVGNGDFASGDVYFTGTGKALPLDWRWVFAAAVLTGLVLIARVHRVSARN